MTQTADPDQYWKCLRKELRRLPKLRQALKTLKAAKEEFDALGLSTPLDLPEQPVGTDLFLPSINDRLRWAIEGLESLVAHTENMKPLSQKHDRWKKGQGRL